MKIVFMTSGTIKGSLSYRPLSFAKELAKNGHDISIIAPRFDKYSKFLDKKTTIIDGVKIIRPWQPKLPNFELSLIPYIISSIFLLFKLTPDIIHLFKPNPITIGGLLLKFTKNTPILLDVDDLDVEVMKIEKNPLLKIMLVELSEKIISKYANGFTTASKYLYNYYSKKYPKKSVTYVSNGAEFNNLEKPSIKNLSQKIVFLGNINRTNILEPLFYAIKHLINKKIKIKVSIIGHGQYLNYFKKLSKKLNIESSFIFYGHIERSKLGNYINPGDIGYSYMPNEETIKACSSMKVFQYMQYGAIPLVSNVGDFPLYTFNGKTGFIAKHSNQKNLTETLIKIIKNQSERTNKIDYAKAYASKKYNWQALTAKIEKTYLTLLKNK